MAHEVFICHSAEDRVVALAACAKLEANGIRCWIAPRDPIAGIPYARQLIDAIGASRLVLLIFSGNANKSEHVLRELGIAADRNKVVVPLRTEDTLPTGDLEYYIQRVHWLDAMAPPLESRLDELVVLARRILNMSPPSVERSVPAPPRTREWEASSAGPVEGTQPLRLALIAGSVVIALGLAIVVGLWVGRPVSQVYPVPSSQSGAAAEDTILPTAVPSKTKSAHMSSCATFIDDPNPPTNVRSEPASSGLVLTTLPNHSQLTIDGRENGWSHISSPVSGWVFSSLTTVQCK